MRLTHAARVRAYGPPCSSHQLLAAEVWGQRVRVHRLIHAEFIHACRAAHQGLIEEGAQAYLPQRVDSYVCRPIAGSSSWSLHAFGLAFDIFRTPPGVPPPGGVWTPAAPLHPAFVAAFTSRGWTWGGNWQRRDTPHFEWAGPPPGSGAAP